MTPLQICGIVIGVLLLIVIIHLCITMVAATITYVTTLVRKNKKKWDRSLQFTREPQISMDAIGIAWMKENEQYKEDVHVVNGKINLYGEYFDFGNDKCAMILSGRTESLRYGYYFAKPYAESGYNVLVMDPRAHGLSDGVFNTLGREESKDDLKWIDFLIKEKGIKQIVLHGICIGAAGGMYTITNPECPDCVAGIVTEGMFARFYYSMRNHLIELHTLVFPVMQCINLLYKICTGYTMRKGPIDIIDTLNKPLLMLHSKEDPYSTPDYAQKLYDKCGSKDKQLVWWPKGGHSQLRFIDTEKYDNSIKEFLKKLNSEN
ncbi:MAG: hypothetical protein IKT55_06030 [Clostridia bacterium]|jgi:alpha-beta hydrolase superfamily lysophospholipase|nr:hypothetical protein [Clostridia bacterium]